MTNLNTIKNWFKTGLYPTQQQFSDTWDSFWHKDEVIPVGKIENLDTRFNEKADEDAFNSHITDLSAHGKHGRFSIADEGQAIINIPHGIGAIPSYWNVRPINSSAKFLGIAEESADETHIIITLVTTNNDNEQLKYLWQAKL